MDAEDRRVLSDQLKNLNERSRWYEAQAWQVPFAYAAASGGAVALLTTTGASDGAVMAALILASAVGVLVVIHLFGTFREIRRAVDHIAATELKLLGESTVKIRPSSHWSLFVMVPLLVYSYLGIAAYLYTRH